MERFAHAQRKGRTPVSAKQNVLRMHSEERRMPVSAKRNVLRMHSKEKANARERKAERFAHAQRKGRTPVSAKQNVLRMHSEERRMPVSAKRNVLRMHSKEKANARERKAERFAHEKQN